MSNITDIRRALNSTPYNPQRVMDALKQFPEIKRVYSLLNSRKRSYSLEEHTLMVCTMFEKYFSSVAFPEEFGIDAFRLLLCLHDIGKPDSLLANEKPLQNQYTENMIKEISEFLPVTPIGYKTLTALLSDDPLGLYIRGKIDSEEARLRINDMVRRSGIEKGNFLKLLFIYYQVDSSAYTKEGYIGEINEFNEKPKLENIFQKDSNGNLVYSSKNERLLFSSEIENSISLLCECIEVCKNG